MPIRIRPNYNLDPCVLDLKSLEEITRILYRSFPDAKFSASTGNWEIYDEFREPFLGYITKQDTLESFHANAEGILEGSMLKIELAFDEELAKVSFIASPEHENWIDHFMMDLKKQLLPLSFRQKFSSLWNGRLFGGPLFMPYSRIIIKRRIPNPLIENIMANILSNIIWVILGMIILFGAQFVYKSFGINL